MYKLSAMRDWDRVWPKALLFRYGCRGRFREFVEDMYRGLSVDLVMLSVEGDAHDHLFAVMLRGMRSPV